MSTRLSVSRSLSHEEYRRSRFYQEWARPQGWIDIVIAVQRNPQPAGVARYEADGMVDDEMRRRVALVTLPRGLSLRPSGSRPAR